MIHDISNDKWTLFDIEADPLESNDLASASPEALAAMRAKLEARVLHAAKLKNNFEFSRALDLSAAQRENLQALGYLGDDQTAGGSQNEEEEQ